MSSPLIERFDALKRAGHKGLAILLDPDKAPLHQVDRLIPRLEKAGVDFIMVGGSLIQNRDIERLVPHIKAQTDIPVVLFPGNLHQIVPTADALLLLSLISGRNPDLLIGRHVEAAPLIRAVGLETLSTGYMLIEAGNFTTVNYISQTLPIPREKSDIATCTALAGEMIGMRLIYLDGGSGAKQTIPEEMIRSVAHVLHIPLIVGGGIRSATDAQRAWMAGADVIVVGSAIERDPEGDLLYALKVAKEASKSI